MLHAILHRWIDLTRTFTRAIVALWAFFGFINSISETRILFESLKIHNDEVKLQMSMFLFGIKLNTAKEVLLCSFCFIWNSYILLLASTGIIIKLGFSISFMGNHFTFHIWNNTSRLFSQRGPGRAHKTLHLLIKATFSKSRLKDKWYF